MEGKELMANCFHMCLEMIKAVFGFTYCSTN